MRFKRHLELEQGLKQIHLSPLIGIVLLLLAFFILTSGFFMQTGLRVSLPKIITSEAVKHENVRILITASNDIYLDGAAVTMQGLKELLKQAAKRGQSLIIDADKRATLGRVAEVWDIARDTGISQINLATNQE